MNKKNTKEINYYLSLLKRNHYDRRYLINTISLNIIKITALIKDKNDLANRLRVLEKQVRVLPFTNVCNNSNMYSNFANEQKALIICNEAIEIIETLLFQHRIS